VADSDKSGFLIDIAEIILRLPENRGVRQCWRSHIKA
jgi:hypothetical protein